MAGLLNLGEMPALAMHVMVELAKSAERDASARVNVGGIAETLQASPHTLHKVVTRLVNAGLVDSARGPSGGLRLRPGAEETSLLEVVEAVEGAAHSNGCLFARRVCPVDAPCIFKSLTGELEGRIREEFRTTTVADLLGTPAMAVTEKPKRRKAASK